MPSPPWVPQFCKLLFTVEAIVRSGAHCPMGRLETLGVVYYDSHHRGRTQMVHTPPYSRVTYSRHPRYCVTGWSMLWSHPGGSPLLSRLFFGACLAEARAAGEPRVRAHRRGEFHAGHQVSGWVWDL